MKPTELRIGCYVKLRGTDKIVRVSSITNRKIGFHWGSDKTLMYYYRYSEIEPVLIWDVKDKFKHPRELSWNDINNHKEIYHYQDIPLTDFHELQNIHFALTGNEIELDL